MRAAILKRAGRAFGQTPFASLSRGVIVTVALLLAATSLSAAPSMTTLGGGNPNVNPKYRGYSDGLTLSQALFYTPCGLALDSSGELLYVADRDNNRIRFLDLVSGWTWTFDIAETNLLKKPIAVYVDSFYFVYVLNRGTTNAASTTGTVELFDNWGDHVATCATGLTNATGMAVDYSGNIYVTVRSNQLIRIDAGTSNRTTIATIPNSGTSLQGIVIKQNGLIAACDAGRNGIYLINPTNGVVSTNAGFHGTGDFTTNGNNIASSSKAKFNQPLNVVEAGDGTLIVTDNGNTRVKAVLPNGVVTNVCGVTRQYWGGTYPGWYDGSVSVPDSIAPNVQCRLPVGIVIAPDGTLYTTEDYYHTIRHITGGNFAPRVHPPTFPNGLTATAGYGQVALSWLASGGATYYNIKRSFVPGGPYTNVLATSTTTGYTDTNVVDGMTYYYVVSAANTGGESGNSPEASATPMFSPVPTFVSVTTNYGLVGLTWSSSSGATSYNLKRAHSSGGPYTIIAHPTSTTYNDTGVTNGTTYYYVVSAVNPGGESTNSAEVGATPPLAPVGDPQIGWVSYPPLLYLSVFHNDSAFVFNNDVDMVIVGEQGSQVYYSYGATPAIGSIPDPIGTNTFFSAPPGYLNGLSSYEVEVDPGFTVASIMPDLTIKAIGTKLGGYPNSSIVQARFQFVVANPLIVGNNAGLFVLSDITDNCTFWYTTDGVDPTNSPGTTNFDHSILLCTNAPIGTNLISLSISSNFMFKVRAFKNNYQPSGIVTWSFASSNFVPNTISFGFSSGEASSDFIASPGQTFYAPITLSVLPITTMYSLQFNVTLTGGPTNPGTVIPGAFNFETMLKKPDPDEQGYFLPLYPYMYIDYAINPPPPNQIIFYQGESNYISLVTADTNLNLLSVGWLERYTKTNLYNTKAQDLIQFSMAHDTLFQQADGKVVLGGYMFQVPMTATPGETYQIQIGRPSATSDGIGAPGSSVFIYTPTNGSLGGGVMNSIKIVTVGQRKYIAGDVYPFRWFNAGDFGNTNLENADVMQIFQSAIYGLNYPPFDGNSWNGTGFTNVSDFFDGMDSCGYTYTDNGFGYLQPNVPVAAPNALFDANDTSIDQIAFGDGWLDVCDVYVTYRRSLQTNLLWFNRYWTNDVAHGVSGRVAEITPNIFNPKAVAQKSLLVSKIAQQTAANTSVTNQPRINFAAGDIQTAAGSTVQIPITARIFGNYPLRLLMLNFTVVPLDGSPALTTPVSFSYNTGLGSPWTTDQHGNGNYSAVWLNKAVAGLTGDVTIGTLTVTIPTNATSSSAYAVHFDHVSASPNGLASFPKLARTGLITFANRSASSYGDSIPDSWRLRYFLTLNNCLSATNADADGDGANNLQEYCAGTDPTDIASCFKNIGLNRAAAQSSSDCVISWPSANGKQYVIERSPSLSAPIWSSVATNSGNGNVMEYHDATGGGVRFYRVRVQ
jgi:hypothetical protein